MRRETVRDTFLYAAVLLFVGWLVIVLGQAERIPYPVKFVVSSPLQFVLFLLLSAFVSVSSLLDRRIHE